MATGSTKRNRKKARGDWGAVSSSSAKRQPAEGAGRRKQAAPPPPPAAPTFELSARAWAYASIAVLLAAALLRLYALELKPLHHDEGVNGFFLTNLLRKNSYAYDPANYHGPTLYYLTLPFVAAGGLSTFAVRLVPVLFGVGTVWLVLGLRRWVGWVAALSAAALVAVSPGFVFYSRYFIHEMPFVFFTLGLVVAALRFRESGAPSDLLLASASAAMMFATKETAFISVGTLCLAWLTAVSWERLKGDARVGRGEREGERADGWARLREGGSAGFIVASAAVLFVLIWVAFYTSFFFNSKGLADSFKAFAIWQKTGMSEFHGKPWDTYVRWLLKEDAAILVLGALGAAVALFERRRNRFAVFFAAWGFGLLAAYSLISYKTPWLVLNFLLPLAVAAGYAVQAFGARAARWWRGRPAARWQAAVALLPLALGLGLYETFVINFREYDNDRYPYVYSQTQRHFLDLVREIERVGERAGTREPGFATASPDYWPLPWYFSDNSHAGYEGRLSTYYDPKSTLAVIGKEEQLPQLERVLADSYARVGGLYPLRPGVNLVLYARSDLAGPR
ncbi:MAG: TIGR03663 family protein [Acidobacteria bacterium]|nr:TIGR03663 family protein [Acidobacteriota bacterium]